MNKKRRTSARFAKSQLNKKSKLESSPPKVEIVEGSQKEVTFEDFPRICRICLSPHTELSPFTDLEVIETFAKLTKIAIEPGDGMPDNVCVACARVLEQANGLCVKAQRSNRLLCEVLENKQKVQLCTEEDLKDVELFDSAPLSNHNDSDAEYAPADSPPKQETKCEHCHNSYSNVHVHQKECDARVLECEPCEVVFESVAECNAHMASAHAKQRRFMCHVCSRFCNTKATLDRHLKHHEDQNQVDIYEKGRGRPKLIEKEKLELCLSRNYTGKQIAKHLGVSMSCVYKTCYMHGIKLLRSRYTEIEDDALQREIECLHKQFPNSGSEMMNGHLLAKGICVQRKRIRQLLSKIDPSGTAHRLGTPTNRKAATLKTEQTQQQSANAPSSRRSYIVPAPNSLWHMDANLKLARWGLVTHGCIDGYSRLVLYLECKSSSLATAVIPLFTSAVRLYGLPTNVQSDFGYDQSLPVLVTDALRKVNARFSNVEKPAHNQRIKKLWIDVYKQVIDIFFKDFAALEESGDLNCDDDLHKIALHTVYLGEINRKLNLFVHAWNSHKIRTANGKSPIQIFTAMVEPPNDVSAELIAVLNEGNLHVNVVNSPHRLKNNDDLLAKYSEDKHVERILLSNIEARAKYVELLDYLRN